MESTTLEKRVETLEHEIHIMKEAFQKFEQKEQPWWISQAGIFKDDPLFDRIVEAGQQYRKTQVETEE